MCEKLTELFWRLPLTFDTTLQRQWSAKPMSSSAIAISSVSVSAFARSSVWTMSRAGVTVDDAIGCCCCCCWPSCPLSFVQCVCMPLPSRRRSCCWKEASTHRHTCKARCIVISGRVAGTLSGNSCLCSCLDRAAKRYRGSKEP